MLFHKLAGGFVNYIVGAMRVMPYALVASPAMQNLLFLIPELFPDNIEIFLTNIADNSRMVETLPRTFQNTMTFVFGRILGGDLMPFHKMRSTSLDIILF